MSDNKPRLKPCRACDGQGKLKIGGAIYYCEICGGTGHSQKNSDSMNRRPRRKA